MIGRREFVAGLGSAAAWPAVAGAQQRTIPVVGVLGSTTGESFARPLAASADAVVGATTNATCRRTKSAANADSRSLLFSAQRYSTITLRPST